MMIDYYPEVDGQPVFLLALRHPNNVIFEKNQKDKFEKIFKMFDGYMDVGYNDKYNRLELCKIDYKMPEEDKLATTEDIKTEE